MTGSPTRSSSRSASSLRSPRRRRTARFESAQPIPEPPLVVEGGVSGNDVDFYRFRGRKGQQIVVDAQCARIGSGLDPTIRLTTAAANRDLRRLGRRHARALDRRPADGRAPRGRATTWSRSRTRAIKGRAGRCIAWSSARSPWPRKSTRSADGWGRRPAWSCAGARFPASRPPRPS